MAIEEKDSITKRMTLPKRIYSNVELEQFDKCMQKYKIKKTLSGGDVVELYDWDTIYFKAGVRSKDGRVLVHNPEYGKNKMGEIHIMKCYTPQLEFDNKAEQWAYWKRGEEYRDERRFVDYQKVAEEMTIKDPFDNW